jgi:hypothetical protein
VKKQNTNVLFIGWLFTAIKLYNLHPCYEIIPHRSNKPTQETGNLRFTNKLKCFLIPDFLYNRKDGAYLCPTTFLGTWETGYKTGLSQAKWDI